MRGFQKRARTPSYQKVLLAFCFIALVVGIAIFARRSDEWFGDAYITVTRPVRWAAGFPWRVARYAKNYIASRVELGQALHIAKGEIDRLRGNIAELDMLRSENAALRAAVGSGNIAKRKIVARVVGKGAHVFGQEIVLDRGSANGIREGDAVVFGERTLVGKITSATPRNARVMLVGNRDFRATVRVLEAACYSPAQPNNPLCHPGLDPGSRMLDSGWSLPSTAMRGRNDKLGTEGLVRGEGFGRVMLDMVPQDAFFKENDVVVTSGFDGVFPPGLLVGMIEKITSGPSDFFQKASVVPAADLGVIDVMSVLLKEE